MSQPHRDLLKRALGPQILAVDGLADAIDQIVADALTGYSTTQQVLDALNGALINTPLTGNTTGNTATFAGGVGFFGHAAPTSRPAAPVTLADVIAIVRGCGLSA